MDTGKLLRRGRHNNPCFCDRTKTCNEWDVNHDTICLACSVENDLLQPLWSILCLLDLLVGSQVRLTTLLYVHTLPLPAPLLFLTFISLSLYSLSLLAQSHWAPTSKAWPREAADWPFPGEVTQHVPGRLGAQCSRSGQWGWWPEWGRGREALPEDGRRLFSPLACRALLYMLHSASGPVILKMNVKWSFYCYLKRTAESCESSHPFWFCAERCKTGKLPLSDTSLKYIIHCANNCLQESAVPGTGDLSTNSSEPLWFCRLNLLIFKLF